MDKPIFIRFLNIIHYYITKYCCIINYGVLISIDFRKNYERTCIECDKLQ